MGRSIIGLVGLAATLVFALPAALLGIEFLVGGRFLWGGALVTAAVLMVAIEEHVTTPGDLTGIVAERTIGRLPKTPDEEE